jgi:elongation factor 3
VGAAGFASLQANGLLTKLKAEAEDMNNADAREAALLAFKQLCQCVGRPCEPYVVPLLPMMLERLADKAAPVRDAAGQAAKAVVSILCPHAVELVLPGTHRGQEQLHTLQEAAAGDVRHCLMWSLCVGWWLCGPQHWHAADAES